MFAEPTIADFEDRINWHLEKACFGCQNEIASINRKANAAGSFYSGVRVKSVSSTAEKEFDKGIISALGELKRVSLLGVLDLFELRAITHQKVENFAKAIVALAKPAYDECNVPQQCLEVLSSNIERRRSYLLRQFDVGFEDPPLPEEPMLMSNNIRIGTMIGGGIQQGTAESKQTLEQHIDATAALEAIASLEEEVANLRLEAVQDLRIDLDAIKSQLSKSTPNNAIVIEAGRSIRNIAEGILAGAMTDRSVRLVTDLMRALGIG